MKLNKKIIALLLTLSIVFSVVMPLSLTSGATTATSGVILEWDFNTVEDNKVIDSSGNNNHGIIDGATVANGVASFTGTKDIEYIHLPTNLFDGCNANDTITIELVINPAKTENHITFLHFGESGTKYSVLAIMGGNNLRFATETNGQSAIINSTASPLTTNASNFVKYVFTPTKTIIYVNDIYVTAVSTDEKYFLGNFDDAYARLGGKAFWDDTKFEGTIDYLKISVSETVEKGVDRSEKPTLAPITDDVEMLGYINFANPENTWTNVSDVVGETVDDENGIATFSGIRGANDDNITNVNAVQFDSSLLADIKDTLTIEMTIKPTEIPEHGVIMSIGDKEDFYVVMGTRTTNALKFNEGRTNDNIIKPGEWITLKYVINESGAYIYVNDDLYCKTIPISLKRLANSNEPIKFGQRTIASWNDASFAGDVSEIRITTSKSGRLNFALQAVNFHDGVDTLTANSKLTVQYTDATIGTESDPVKLKAKITDKTTGTELYSQEIATLAVQTRDVYADYGSGGGAGTISGVDIYSDVAGSISFTPGNAVAGKNISNLEVTIWTDNGDISSNPATTTINNGFIAPATTAGESKTPDVEDAKMQKEWMKYIDGATLLSQINMPGTHDSTTQNVDNFVYSILGTVIYDSDKPNKCQDTDILTQMNYGVRYLDIRANTSSYWNEGVDTITVDNETKYVNNFGLSHSTFVCYKDSGKKTPLTFVDVYNDCASFLKANPSECIVLGVVNEPNETSDRGKVLSALDSFVTANPDLFYTQNNEIPTLDDVRGKIVILRRFPDNNGGESGYMDFFWQDNSDNTEHGIFMQNGNVALGQRSTAVTTYFVQDHYDSDVPASNKWSNYAKPFLDKASGADGKGGKKANQYYINFFSVAAGLTTNSNIKEKANEVNRNFTNTKLTQGVQYGWLLFDFITPEICRQVYETNIFTTTAQATAENNNNSKDVVVHYDFAKVENNVVEDKAANGFNGSMLNADALEFNSIYDIITFNNSGMPYGTISVPQGAFRGTGETVTIQAWVKGDLSSDSALLGTGTATDNRDIHNKDNYFSANANGDYKFVTTKVGSATETSASSNISDLTNEWHLLTYVLNKGEMKVYLDDTQKPIASGAVNADFADVSGGIFKDSSLILGASGIFSLMGFNGSMGDFRIYNYAVDTDTIAGTYSALADEYTYITKATLGDNIEILASRTPSESYIEESNAATGSTIWFTLPAGSALTSVPLNLEYDSSDKAMISINGAAPVEFEAGKGYDLSGDVVLTLKSIDDRSDYVKTYNVKVNGIVKKDWKTGEFMEILPHGSEFTKHQDATDLYVGWYTAQNGDIPNQAPKAGDIVYDRTVAITKPILTEKSIRGENREQGLTKGIRFKATIAREDFYNYLYGNADYVYENATNFKFGMLMLPADMLDGGELTVETTYVLDIEGKNVYDQKNKDGNLEFTGCLVNLTEKFCDVPLVARAYIAYTFVDEAGEEKVYYIYSDPCEPVAYNDDSFGPVQ